jgi:dipeptidyl aminopeptidase/acylaminoacyl peptidase
VRLSRILAPGMTAAVLSNSRRISRRRYLLGALIRCCACSLLFAVHMLSHASPNRPFTVGDDIALARFGGDERGKALRFSPDQRYVAAYVERGVVESNRIKGSLLIYSAAGLKMLAESSVKSIEPEWIIDLELASKAPAVVEWKWLDDSRAVALLRQLSNGNQQLVLARVSSKTIIELTPESESVEAFDIRDESNYVYTRTFTAALSASSSVVSGGSIVTGISLPQLLFPQDPRQRYFAKPNLLIHVIDGKPTIVSRSNRAILIYDTRLALAPNGTAVVTTLPRQENRPLSSGQANTESFLSPRQDREYVRIDLRDGAIQSLTGARTGTAEGWYAGGSPKWSIGGDALLLPNTYIRDEDKAPCIAVVVERIASCVQVLTHWSERIPERGYTFITDCSFVDGSSTEIRLTFKDQWAESERTVVYHRRRDSGWRAESRSRSSDEAGSSGIQLTIAESFVDQPRLFVVKRNAARRLVLDPNPYLKDVALGEARLYRWKDGANRNWIGALYLPPGYKAGTPLPIVVQTHGFDRSEFQPSGRFPTAFAARALAAVGIAVIQVDDDACPSPPGEESCAVAGYESAVEQLALDGIADPSNVGIIGFSRTCYLVLSALVNERSVRFKAASIAEGVTQDYFQYMVSLDSDSGMSEDSQKVIGTQPFGPGLLRWTARSPGFNLHKLEAPLLVSGSGEFSMLFMWQPYAALRYMKKPVELVMLNSNEHILSNPAARMFSQQGSVDWFRFWLKDEEDDSPQKLQQYSRWRALRLMSDRRSRAPLETPEQRDRETQ